ncbi:MAG: exodeoxyribonuclease VII large subunit [Anaerolineaceae bacterium]|jgi:exodeoxyribonuclease VII large subunit|nr:MAG: exodeoxyribonuclease VII large subunit [Anaerolineaceae bacterium]
MLKESLFPLQVYSVSEVTGYIRVLLEENPDLQDIWIQGEVSNASFPSSGHVYFTLKDAGASLRCVIWKWTAQYLHVRPEDGMAVDVHGKFSVYEKGGQYQFYVDSLRLQGEGKLYQEFLRLKRTLEEEGLFDAQRKKTIPAYPKLIGIVTSSTGAALQDILNTLQKRFPLVEVLLSPTSVQGEGAAHNIVRALQTLENYPEKPDVIILARGGGSLEDLWPFNEEEVVRAVAAAQIPIISGVGHETDFTLVDFVADLRAPTPTGAAVLAVPDSEELKITIQEIKESLIQVFREKIQDQRTELKENRYKLQHLSPERTIQQAIIQNDDFSRRLQMMIRSRMELLHANLDMIKGRFHALDPMAVLQRGYALVFDPQGKLVDSIAKTNKNEKIGVRLKDGTLAAEVISIDRHE